MMSAGVCAKSIATCQKTYGVDKACQTQEFKDYTLPSGKVIQVQVYDPYALDILFKAGYDEDDIITDVKEVPQVTYKMTDGTTHKYLPDIYVKSENWLIEVKSTLTLETGNDMLPVKNQACVDAGYYFDVWTFDSKGEVIMTYNKH